MNETQMGLSEQYATALRNYVHGQGERALQRAYEIGREAIGSGLGVLDIAAIYQQCLAQSLQACTTVEDGTRIARLAAEFFIESLSPFEMAQRGYQDASAALLWLNDTLERRKRADEERAGLLVLEQKARAEAEAAQQRLGFLADASALLDVSLDYTTTLRNLARLIIPRLADWCVIDVMTAEGAIANLIVEHANASLVGLARELQQRYPPDPNDDHGVSRVLRTKESELHGQLGEKELDALARDAGHYGMLQKLGCNSMMIVPLVARQRTLGALTLVRGQASPIYIKKDLDLAEDLARRSALAVDNAKLYSQAQRAIGARDELLSIVSHDLRNPLGVILMSAMILIRNSAAAGYKPQEVHQLEAIRRSAERMNHLIQDLLDVAKIESGHLPIERRPHEPAGLIKDAIESLKPLAERKSLKLMTDQIAELPPVWADRDRVFQVFSNLIGNAIKFTPESGDIRVSVGRGENCAVFSVRDSGPGISPENLPHIFDRFWQAKHAAKLGTGLGLSIAKGIVEAHGGTIRAESQVGQGTTFVFTLPFGEEPAQQPG